MSQTIKIDGVTVPFVEGQTIMQAAEDAGIFIPHLCYHPDYAANGSCKLCTCKVNGRQISSCTTPAQPGQVVESNTEELNSERRALTQMLFVEGNHHCPSCEESGNCVLQNMAHRLEMTALTFPNFYPGRPTDASHPDILLNRDRCIYCELCVRASHESDGKDVFCISGRAENKSLAVNSPTGLLADSDLDLDDAAADICPVGALIRKREGFSTPIGEREFDINPGQAARIRAPTLPSLPRKPGEKIRIATCSLAGCFGCHMSMLDIDERMLDLAEVVTFDRTPLDDLKDFTQDCDVGLIEGGVCNTENVETLREFRKHYKVLIAVGACAINGGVPSLRNGIDVRELLEESYIHGMGVDNAGIPTDPELPHILENVSPIHEVVKVDYFLPGCPPPADAFWHILDSIVRDQQPDLPYDLMHFD